MAKVKDDAERRLSMLAAAISAIGGVQVAFFPIWFGARGLGGAEIATLLAAAPAARIVSNLVGTHLGDRRGDYGRLILLHLFGVALIFIAFRLSLPCALRRPYGVVLRAGADRTAQRRPRARRSAAATRGGSAGPAARSGAHMGHRRRADLHARSRARRARPAR